ncbi:MAG: T9SS type A sorting domain-containing protein [Bacteroidales bacterium]|nr:T9SS type A sorting domain-containing protein [Bacteroidales bacterium]
MKHLFLSILLLASLFLPAQNVWVGGLNACQFGRMDLDGDGKKDLLVFDRHGDRLLCYINKGRQGEIRYEYTSAYDTAFPRLNGWVVFADYDGDGKEDVFTYSKGWAGIKVYHNVSTSGQLSFELTVGPYLTSWQGGGEVNILATDADYPAIMDLDGDGDLDILTFGVMGVFLEKHVNLSVERYGVRDSLVFERTDQCWGRVAESEEDNVMYLDTCLFGYGLTVNKNDFRHRGATVTVRDMNGDGLLDLLLADVDYPGLTLLMNGGDASNALMVSQTEQFPPSTPVELPSMPVPYFTDINNDGVDDLLVSPFDPNPMASVGKESVWLYLNHGTNEHPDFQLYTKSFLQEEMIDLGHGAYPLVVDWDGDGLKDILLGTLDEPCLKWLRNVGSMTAPAFQITDVSFDFGDHTGLVPACCDFDGDGQQELLVGTAEGRLMLYAHDGTLLDGDYLHYDKPFSAPCFFDVDQDGVVDLVVGNITGKLSFYKRDYITHEWGGVDVRDYTTSYYGYSVPTLFQYGDETLLAVGSESGKVFLFDGVTAEADVAFSEVPERWSELCEDLPVRFGMRSAAAVADFNNDSQLEIMVGNFAGGLQLFNAEISIHNIGLSEIEDDFKVEIFPNPASSIIHVIAIDDAMKAVTVTDLYGRKLMEKSVNAEETVLEVSMLPKGVYLLVVELDRGLVNRIFLKR